MVVVADGSGVILEKLAVDELTEDVISAVVETTDADKVLTTAEVIICWDTSEITCVLFAVTAAIVACSYMLSRLGPPHSIVVLPEQGMLYRVLAGVELATRVEPALIWLPQ